MILSQNDPEGSDVLTATRSYDGDMKSAIRNAVAVTGPFRHIYPFNPNFHQLKGKRNLRMHYLDEGSGETILMLHGNPTWSFYYRSLVKALSPTYRTIVPDHIGCGLSDKPREAQYGFRLQDRLDDVSSLIDSLHINEPITLIAHDWGGMIALCFALMNKERIKRIILMNTSGFLPPGGKNIPLRLKLLRDSGLFSSLLVLGLNVFARGASIMASKKGLSKDVKKGLLAPYDRPTHRLATLKFVKDIPLYPSDPSFAWVKYVDTHLKDLSALPIMILWGKNDFVFDMDYYEEFRKRLPSARFHLFADAGHYLLEDVPEKVVPLVKEFMRR